MKKNLMKIMRSYSAIIVTKLVSKCFICLMKIYCWNELFGNGIIFHNLVFDFVKLYVVEE